MNSPSASKQRIKCGLTKGFILANPNGEFKKYFGKSANQPLKDALDQTGKWQKKLSHCLVKYYNFLAMTEDSELGSRPIFLLQLLG